MALLKIMRNQPKPDPSTHQCSCHCHYMYNYSNPREDVLLGEAAGTSSLFAMAICPSVMLRSKAIRRTGLSTAGRVRVSLKPQKLLQIVLLLWSSLWNHLNCKQWKFTVRPAIVSEPQGYLRWRRKEFLTSMLPAQHLRQQKEQMFAGGRRALTCAVPLYLPALSAWSWGAGSLRGTPWKCEGREVEILSILPSPMFISCVIQNFIIPFASKFRSQWSFWSWESTEKVLQVRK